MHFYILPDAGLWPGHFHYHFGSGISKFVLLSLLFEEWVACMGVMVVAGVFGILNLLI